MFELEDEVKLPPGYRLDPAANLPPGYSLDVAMPGPAEDVEKKKQEFLYKTPEGIPVYKATQDAAWKEPEGSAISRGAKGAWDTTIGGLLGMLKSGVALGSAGPSMQNFGPGTPAWEVIEGLVMGHVDQAQKAKEAWEKGRYSEAFGHSAATILPFIGPGAAHAGESFGADDSQKPVFDRYGNVIRRGQLPDIASGVGETIGSITSAVVPMSAYRAAMQRFARNVNPVADAIYRRLEMVVDAMEDTSLSPRERAAARAQADGLLDALRKEEGQRVLPRLFPNPNQAEREAYSYMRGIGAAPSAGAASGSSFVRGAQHLTGMTPAGAMMDVRAKGRTVDALRANAQRLVSEAMPEEGRAGQHYSEFERAANQATAEEVPLYLDKDGSQVTGNVKIPVDIRDLKYEMQPLYDKMELMPMSERSTSHAYSALKVLLNANDFYPATSAEFALSQFKAAARSERGGISEAIAKRIIPQLQASIDSAVGREGDSALGALRKGRAAAAKEAGADWLSEQFKKAQQEGGFGHEKAMWNTWTTMPETAKRSMFTGEQIAELNKFFLGLKMFSENPNPSGTALVGAIMAQGGYALHGGIVDPAFWLGQLSSAAIGKLLRTDTGVKLLTDGLRIPRNSERGNFIQKKLEKILGEDRGETPPPQGPPGGPPQGPPAGGPSAGGGRFSEFLRRLLPEEEGSVKITLGGEYGRHLPPPEGEPVSPLKGLRPEETRRRGTPEGSLHDLRRAAERDPRIGSPDNERIVLKDAQGEFAVGKITPQDWLKRVQSNLSGEELAQARRWYRELQGFFEQHFGKAEGPKMMLAWLSSQQNVSPAGGMTNVLRALDQVRGMPKEKVAGLAEAKILDVLRGVQPAEGYGPKLNDFVDSGLGKTTRTWMGDDPRGGQPAVVDVWANRDVGKIDKKLYEYLEKRFGKEAVQKLKQDGNAIGETDYEYGSRFYNDVVKALNEAGFDGGNWKGSEVQAVGWVAMQKALGAVPEYAADLITKNTRRYGYEIHPGEGAPILQQYPWHTLSTEQQAQITDYVGQRVTDLAAQLTGSKVTNRQVSVGAYQGKPTVSVQMDVFASPEGFRDFARVAGYLGQQSEVWNVRPLKSGNSWAYFIRGEGLNTPELQQEFWLKLRDKVGADLVPGFSSISGEGGGAGLFIVNPFSKQYLFERGRAGFKNPTTMRPWTGADKAKIEAGMKSVADEMGLNLDVDFDKVDLGASLHNWARKGKNNGHLQGLVKTGRSAIADQLSNLSSDSLQSWWREAWDRYAGGAPQGRPAAPAQKVNPAKQAFDARKATSKKLK